MIIIATTKSDKNRASNQVHEAVAGKIDFPDADFRGMSRRHLEDHLVAIVHDQFDGVALPFNGAGEGHTDRWIILVRFRIHQETTAGTLRKVQKCNEVDLTSGESLN